MSEGGLSSPLMGRQTPDRFGSCAADAVRSLLSVLRGSWLSWRNVEITALLSSVGPEGQYPRGCLPQAQAQALVAPAVYEVPVLERSKRLLFCMAVFEIFGYREQLWKPVSSVGREDRLFLECLWVMISKTGCTSLCPGMTLTNGLTAVFTGFPPTSD